MPPTAGELGALSKDGLPQNKSQFDSKQAPLPQLSAAQRAKIEAQREANRAARGPALVDTFKDHKRQRTGPPGAPGPRGDKATFNWSRDDMSTRKMDAKAAADMIEQARGLDSRFSSSMQTNFL